MTGRAVAGRRGWDPTGESRQKADTPSAPGVTVTESPTDDDGPPTNGVTTERRRFLRAAGAAGSVGLAATSGCLGVLTGSEPARFTAGVARVPAETRADTGFETFRVETVTSEREFSAGGQTRSVVADNTLAEYDRAVEIPNVGRYRAALYATFTTPAVEVLGQTFNPVADASPAEIARQTLARVESLESPESTGETTLPFVDGETTVGQFETDATLVDGVELSIDLFVTEPVQTGGDFVVGVAGFPTVLPQTDAVETLLAATTHDEEAPTEQTPATE